jgi:RNA polymerase sigma factor for flagellar operon FliA
VSEDAELGAAEPAGEPAPPRPELIQEGLALLAVVARRMARRLGGTVPVDDLVSIGNFALVEIARSWDPARSAFGAHATIRLRWAMLDGVRKETHGRRAAARASALLCSERLADAYEANAYEGTATTSEQDDQAAFAEMLGGHAAAMVLGLVAHGPDGSSAETPEERLAAVETAARVRAVVAALPDRERALVERHYFGDEQFDAIARDLGITKSWASRLYQRAVSVLARQLGDEAPGR